MHIVKPTVDLIPGIVVPGELLQKIYQGYRRCYSDKVDVDFLETPTEEEMEKFIRKMRKTPHLSPLEHVSLTFHIGNVSRAMTHQLVRHRIASYCIAGDTRISTSSQRTNKKTIEELYKMPLQYRKQIKARCIDEKSGLLGYNSIKNIIYSGKKPVCEVVTRHGYTIKATLEHRFLTDEGWKRLKDIHAGDKVYINGVELYKDRTWLCKVYQVDGFSQKEIAEMCGVSKRTIRAWIRHFGLQKEAGSWSIGKKPHNAGKTKESYAPLMTVSEKMQGNRNCLPESRAGDCNPMWKGGAVGIGGGYARTHRTFSKTGKCALCGFYGVTELHHKDKNPCNTSSDNMIELCIACHKALHKKEVREKAILSEVLSISPVGVVDTYDIEMYAPHHNFVANGFIVHNSQQSQRYVQMDDLPIVMPSFSYIDDEETKKTLQEIILKTAEYTENAYADLISLDVKPEDARSVLPNFVATQIVVTMNLRSLLHFFEERMCYRAQEEIRIVADMMYNICNDILPCVFENAGPKCMLTHSCPEHHPCGKKPYARVEKESNS